MKYYKLLLLIFVFNSCDVSQISKADTMNLAKLKVNILIQDGTKDHTLEYIKVKLSDGKKQIINKDIKVLLNDLPLDLYIKNELYYTKTSFYKTDSLLRNDSYYFEMILPDSTRYPIAFIKPMKKERDTKFSIPEKVSLQEDFVIKWENLSTPYKLEIIKGIEVKKKKAKNITEYGYGGNRIDTLKEKAGEYIIPKSYFIDSLTITRNLEITLTRNEKGLINQSLLKNSQIIYNYTIKKTIETKNNSD
ncbi:hypothetical protein [Aquimarina sp. 2201CG14-23]|uniref:hypothetical protein n=1 Tax=Aquimarina mycalae TaxID=3040073 RepID=UPI002477EFE9|nr:hypothetical protein [Aquimarina sp. 2201CG14-23]MDH7447582.1 hypothetical protein [Aquimarina sp. 2201CG14-23]